MRILPEYLLLLGLLFGGFSLSGSLAESYISHAEVAYIELLTENSQASEIEVQEFSLASDANQKIQTPFYSFSFRSSSHAHLISHALAREQERIHTHQFHNRSTTFLIFSHLHVPMYSDEDFHIAQTV